MAKPTNTPPNAAAQFSASGYVLNEDAEFALREMFTAMRFTAEACEQSGPNDLRFDPTGGELAATLRTYARLGERLIEDAGYTIGAAARPRSGKVVGS